MRRSGAFLTSLKDRGLGGVKLVISDQHAGLVKALSRCFAGASHQRCRVHFTRNLLALVPKSHKDMVAAVFRTIFAQPDADAVGTTWNHVRNELANAFPKIGPLMDDAKAEVLAFTTFPRSHWTKIWSNNPIVILSQLQGVVDVADGLDRSPIVRAGRAYLQPSSRHGRGRFGVRCSSGGVRLAA
jgi:transposase-like protein